ncbi:MAG: helix-turn-helix transcriptional regulator [Coriobacteriia bacterium]|nr:helix-turn-helix transcriptional regulator [Coriobacteriia bacterium]
MTPRRRAGDSGSSRPLYMISVAAELAGMHPQTLRVYERRELLSPQRSSGNTRLYSDIDIERLRFIQHLTQEEGINLSGVVRIIELEDERAHMLAEMDTLRGMVEDIRRRMDREIEAAHASYRREIVLVPRGGIQRRISRDE